MKSTTLYMYITDYVPKIFLSCLLVLVMTRAYSQQSLAVIANQEGPPASLSFSELKSVFLGEKQRWSSGNKVIIALIKTTNNNKVGLAVCDKIYRMKPDEMNKYWLALVFQGRASAPFFFNTTTELQNFVAQTPGAIGIIDENMNTSDIKTVVVDGKKSL
jgi:ABC-type phosphate transport system substrate-binding protein